MVRTIISGLTFRQFLEQRFRIVQEMIPKQMPSLIL